MSKDLLAEALALAAGRTTEGAALPDELLRYGESLRDLRLSIQSNPACPTAVLRRAQGLFGHPLGAARLLELVYDSWQGLAPALRGGARARSLRYELDAYALELRLVPDRDGRWLVQVAAEGCGPGLAAELDVAQSAPRRLVLDDVGAAQTFLPARTRELIVRVRDGAAEIMRSPPVRLE